MNGWIVMFYYALSISRTLYDFTSLPHDGMTFVLVECLAGDAFWYFFALTGYSFKKTSVLEA